MSTKPTTGLAAFTRKPSTQAEVTPAAPVAAATPTGALPKPRQRGRGETVSLTVRLTRADWERVHQLAVSEGTSIQQLALAGFSRVFAEKGLPVLQS